MKLFSSFSLGARHISTKLQAIKVCRFDVDGNSYIAVDETGYEVRYANLLAHRFYLHVGVKANKDAPRYFVLSDARSGWRVKKGWTPEEALAEAEKTMLSYARKHGAAKLLKVLNSKTPITKIRQGYDGIDHKYNEREIEQFFREYIRKVSGTRAPNPIRIRNIGPSKRNRSALRVSASN